MDAEAWDLDFLVESQELGLDPYADGYREFRPFLGVNATRRTARASAHSGPPRRSGNREITDVTGGQTVPDLGKKFLLRRRNGNG